jgi:FMN phosphatase YigB (HAD superfamily)
VARLLDRHSREIFVTVTVVFLDVGETLVDESRLWEPWAKWLNVPSSVFMATLDSVIRDRAHHRHVFPRLRPGFDLEAAQAERLAAGWPPDVAGPQDLYPDARACLRTLRSLGYRIGVVGNQPSDIERTLRAADLGVDLVASSETWAVSKPSPAFFQRIIDSAGLPAAQIAYVGDRLDNDVLPAVELGMVGVFIRRGPWGRVHADWPEVERASLRVESLEELPAALARHNASHGSVGQAR